MKPWLILLGIAALVFGQGLEMVIVFDTNSRVATKEIYKAAAMLANANDDFVYHLSPLPGPGFTQLAPSRA
jgi:hypothetical protein